MSSSREIGAVESPVVTTSLAAAFAVAAGAAVGNLYWAQPLLAQIAADLGIATSDAGALITATQIGYAVGILLIVPLGDTLDRRKLIAAVMGASAAALLASAFAPTLALLAFALGAVGFTTVSGQIILPLVGDLAAPDERGKMVGIVSSGIMTGILLSRTVSGLVAGVLGWRAIYVFASVLNLVLTLVIVRAVPEIPRRERVPYPQLIASVFVTAARTPSLPRILAMNGLVFCVFNLFWTALTFLLSAEPFGFDTFQIGLVSLAGLTGAVASQGVGLLMDRGLGVPATGAAITLVLASMMLSLFAAASLVLVVVVAAVVALAIQATGILNQTRLFTLAPEARSRLNTAFVVNNFLCGAVGSALASLLWNAGGWTAVSAGGCIAAALSLGVWFLSRRAFSNDEGAA